MIAFVCRRGRNGVLRRLCLATVIGCAVTATAWAQAPGNVRGYALPAASLAQSINAIGQSNDVQVIYDAALLKGKTAGPIYGHLTLSQALDKALVGSGLTYKLVNSGHTVVISKAPLPPQKNNPEAPNHKTTKKKENVEPITLGTVAVTGTRITGAPSASPTIRLSQRQIRATGQYDLGQVIRDLPENFSGGQNPGVAQGAGDIANQNINSGSAVNLRGLGPDATLTLLNGRRLSYDSFVQAVDISAIPLAAVERIEVVPDGASAIYGSDAVAGVVNVILEKDFQGVTAAARLGTATEGGGFQQEYSMTGGTRWSSGGFLASFDYERQEPIRTDQRDYTNYLPTPGDLLPYRRHRNAIFTLHQDIGNIGTFSIDTLYNKRWVSHRFPPFSSAYRGFAKTTAESYAISPTAAFYLPNTWTLTLNGLFGADRTHDIEQVISRADDAVIGDYPICYCNKEKSVEFDGEGPLFTLRGGDAKLAIGAGYRENDYHDNTETARRKSRYAFSELFLPLIGPDNDVPAIYSLSVSAAARYESYDDVGSIITPKLGIIYAPTADFDFKGSWGRSFKTPTLLQVNEESIVYLYPAAVLGGTGYPDDATVLEPYGGNRDLKPERAETWQVTASLHPRSIEGFHVDATYFSVAYRDRVRQPLTNFLAALSDPVYHEFVTYDPSAADLAAVIATVPGGLTVYPGVSYDPDNVVAIANDVYINIARQHIHGVDLHSDYRFDVAGGHIDLLGNASWLTSRQQNSPDAPVFPLAGTIFNPPHFHARAGVIWTRGALTASTFLNWLGPVQDTRSSPPVEGGSMTTLDLALIYHVGTGAAVLRDTEFSISIQNLTDRHPPFLQPQLPYFVNYDSTNYSAIGRFISVGVSKHF